MKVGDLVLINATHCLVWNEKYSRYRVRKPVGKVSQDDFGIVLATTIQSDDVFILTKIGPGWIFKGYLDMMK